MKNAKKLRRKLDYLPSWAWYVLSLCIAGPVGPVVVYLLFYALDKAVKEENESERNGTDWNVDIDRELRGLSACPRCFPAWRALPEGAGSWADNSAGMCAAG